MRIERMCVPIVPTLMTDFAEFVDICDLEVVGWAGVVLVS
jgi:hypothetical protein